jgi:hypothetical protein
VGPCDASNSDTFDRERRRRSADAVDLEVKSLDELR